MSLKRTIARAAVVAAGALVAASLSAMPASADPAFAGNTLITYNSVTDTLTYRTPYHAVSQIDVFEGANDIRIEDSSVWGAGAVVNAIPNADPADIVRNVSTGVVELVTNEDGWEINRVVIRTLDLHDVVKIWWADVSALEDNITVMGGGGPDDLSASLPVLFAPFDVFACQTDRDDGPLLVPVNLYGQGGWDTLSGSPCDDYLYGGSGADLVYGGSGNDFMRAGPNVDNLLGGPGDDLMFTRDFVSDRANGGLGDDHVHADFRDVVLSAAKIL